MSCPWIFNFVQNLTHTLCQLLDELTVFGLVGYVVELIRVVLVVEEQYFLTLIVACDVYCHRVAMGLESTSRREVVDYESVLVLVAVEILYVQSCVGALDGLGCGVEEEARVILALRN